jgi:hypothetical protein
MSTTIFGSFTEHADKIRDALASLVGDNRLDSSAIKNLSSGGSSQVIDHVNIYFMLLEKAMEDGKEFGSIVNGALDVYSTEIGIDTTSIYDYSFDDDTIFPPEDSTNTRDIEFNASANVTFANIQNLARKYVKDSSANTGHLEGETLYPDGAATDEGGGLVGIPVNNSYSSGDTVEIRDSSNYDGSHTVHANTTSTKLVITDTYAAETFSGTTTVNLRCTLGAGNNCVDIVAGVRLNFANESVYIAVITDDGEADDEITLSDDHDTEDITAVYAVEFDDNNTYIQASVAIVADGSTNTSTTIGYTQMTADDAPSPMSASASDIYSGSYPYYYSFDHNNSTRWASTGSYPHWIQLYLGQGETYGKIFNKYRFIGLNSSNNWPTEWTIQARVSDADEWTDLDYQSGISFPSGGVDIYRGFVNSNKYNYWRMYAHLGNSGSSYMSCMGLEFIEAEIVSTTSYEVAYTTDIVSFKPWAWNNILGITTTESTPSGSDICHAISFDGRDTWVIYSSGWVEIVRLNGSTWQYKNASSVWTDSTYNTLDDALKLAFSVAANRMDKAALEAITQTQWSGSGGYDSTSTTTIDFAVGLKADGSAAIPYLTGYSITYDINEQNMSFVSNHIDSLITPTKAQCLIMIENYHSSLEAYIASASSPAWTELTNLTKVYEMNNTIDFYLSDETDITCSPDKEMRIKVTGNYNNNIKIHGYVLAWSD